ncbi:hypothetical protein MVES1_001795 [Malassezia vespertilionis]|uniref:J domain-containing protein n=1 Tax=Malassezia vespertilionis TaxID=2020962 RepID=A0A2N1JDE0_9BASI|nr:uncharacterized protein MVES1_001795 [Malassezia vespertilionis]PKI84568.1 hypothetical protein MVES_001695 [Malassezia vespertilionis]WFD06450.1 hypothetical protein MVES1_001795 [Malassezia vespertilionis]
MGVVQVVVTQLLYFGLWGLVEGIGIRILLECMYLVPLSQLRLQRPQKSSPASATHWQVARIVVVVLYFLYTLHRNYEAIAPNAYEMLGLRPLADDTSIKRQFRQYARLYHPDKTGVSDDAMFIRLHRAYAILSDPVTRFAYDRFGFLVEEWRELVTPREYIRRGMYALCIDHAYLLGAQALAWAAMRSNHRSVGGGTYWSVLLQVYMAAYQAKLILRSGSPPRFLLSRYLTVDQMNTLLLRSFMPNMLALEQCCGSIVTLSNMGRLSHFQWASHGKPLVQESPQAILNMQIAAVLQEEPQTLLDAQQQIELLVGASMQLEAKVRACASIAQHDAKRAPADASQNDTDAPAHADEQCHAPEAGCATQTATAADHHAAQADKPIPCAPVPVDAVMPVQAPPSTARVSLPHTASHDVV